MFGLFSLPKLILLAVIVVGVWYLFKKFSNNNGNGQENLKNQNQNSKNMDKAAQMIACEKCGSFFAEGAGGKNNNICADCQSQ